MDAAIAIIASMALPPSAVIARPSSTAAKWGAATDTAAMARAVHGSFKLPGFQYAETVGFLARRRQTCRAF